jgi:hypothetical protein
VPSAGCDDAVTVGCDGRTYGDECQAVAAGVCPDACAPVAARVLLTGCRSGALAVLRDEASYRDAVLPCTEGVPPPPVDFAREQVVAVCMGICAGVHRLHRVRSCAGTLVVDHSYSNPCLECDADILDCVWLAVPRSSARVHDNAFLECPDGCCDG